MAYKCYTWDSLIAEVNDSMDIYNISSNKLKNLTETDFNTAVDNAISTDNDYYKIAPATSLNITMISNLCDNSFDFYNTSSSQTADNNKRLVDDITVIHPTTGKINADFGVSGNTDCQMVPHVRYTKSNIDTGYSTEYSSDIGSSTWNKAYNKTGFVIGYYEGGSGKNYWTVEEQYENLYDGWELKGFATADGNNVTSYGSRMYLGLIKSDHIQVQNYYSTVSNLTFSWNEYDYTSEGYPSGANTISGLVSEFRWDSSQLNKYNTLLTYANDYGTGYKEIVGLKKSTAIRLDNCFTSSSVENKLNQIMKRDFEYEAYGFIKYLYSPGCPLEIIMGPIAWDNYYFSSALSFDLYKYASNNGSYSVFGDIYDGYWVSNQKYSIIWIYGAYDITKFKKTTPFYNYLLISQINKYWGGNNPQTWSTLNNWGQTNSNTLNILYNGGWKHDTLYNLWTNYLKNERAIGYVIIPLGYLLVSYAYKLNDNFSNNSKNNFISVTSNNTTTFNYPNFRFMCTNREHNGYMCHTINSVIDKVVKCGSSSITKYFLVKDYQKYWWNKNLNTTSDKWHLSSADGNIVF